MLAGIDNDGSIAAACGNLLLYGSVMGTGTLAATTGATLTLQAAVGADQTLAFSPNARAVLDDARAFDGTITGFGAGDVLNIAGTTATSAAWSNGMLTLATAFGAIQLNVSGNYASNGFTVQADIRRNTSGRHSDVHGHLRRPALRFQAVGGYLAVRSTAAILADRDPDRGANGAASIRPSLPPRSAMTRDLRARALIRSISTAADTELQIGAAQISRQAAHAVFRRPVTDLEHGRSVIVTNQGGWSLVGRVGRTTAPDRCRVCSAATASAKDSAARRLRPAAAAQRRADSRRRRCPSAWRRALAVRTGPGLDVQLARLF
jgi:hypothetical protein